MELQKIVILGSTGSIGRQTLEIIREHAGRFEVTALSCNNNWEELAKQINEFRPRYAVLCDASVVADLKSAVSHQDTKILVGETELLHLATLDEADVILNSLVGFAGFEPTVKALERGKKVALANKESLVVGGPLIKELLKDPRNQLIPVDSEHSAILQCLVGEPLKRLEKLIITASGGPFRTWPLSKMQEISVRDALNHPNWSMGAKITVDSATMMNKGLEIIEACWLFDLPLSKIEAVVHPQSIIHSIVTFVDGSSKAQLGPPTMKVPILYALTYPDRLPLEVSRLDWSQAMDLSFEPVDYSRFPCMRLALDALKEGDFAPAVLNAANEIAVQRFLNEEIPYIRIPEVIESCLTRLHSQADLSVHAIKEIDQEARELALTI